MISVIIMGVLLFTITSSIGDHCHRVNTIVIWDGEYSHKCYFMSRKSSRSYKEYGLLQWTIQGVAI